MNTKELNIALYGKLCDEQERYRAWLLSQPSEEILKHTCEYTVRETVLTSFAVRDLPYAEALALMKSSSPIANIYKDWRERTYQYIDDLWETVDNHAKSALRQEQKKAAKRKARAYER